MVIKLVVYFYPFNVSSLYILYCRFWSSISSCSKNKFIWPLFFQSLYVSVKELCIVGYFDNVKATADKVCRELPFLFKEPVGIHNDGDVFFFVVSGDSVIICHSVFLLYAAIFLSCLFANGNVTKIGDTVLQYDSVVKDKLVKIGDKVVTYDANNPLVPTSYDGNTYTFEGRRLARIQKGGKVIDYTYNDQGLRIKKTITENGMSLETRFFYDGTKLIAEITPEHRLDFLYDENDRLYGFVLDKTAMYFYVRDTLENILGIIDKNGNLVVQYAYNAWGKIQSITGTLATTIGEYNPFRYKGYHFDSDTGMYYCHTRYYVPDWCRWLCADGVIGLDPFGLFDQNLYCYCGNDPVNYFDPTGHSAILIGLIIGAIIGAAAGFGLATYKDYKDDGKVFNGSVEWYEYVGLTIAGGVIGGGLGAGAGYIASSIGASFAAGGLSFSSSGAAAMLSSCQTTFVEIASVIGAGVLFASTNRPGDNRKQNEQYREAMRRLGFSKNDWQWRYGHDHLPQKSMGFKELVDFLRSLFSKLK